MLDDVVLVILAARAIMLEDALDDRIVRIHSDEVFTPLAARMSRFASGSIGFRILTALGTQLRVANRERLHGSCEVSG